MWAPRGFALSQSTKVWQPWITPHMFTPTIHCQASIGYSPTLPAPATPALLTNRSRWSQSARTRADSSLQASIEVTSSCSTRAERRPVRSAGLFLRTGFVEVTDGNLPTVACEPQGNGAAQATGSTGDDGIFLFHGGDHSGATCLLRGFCRASRRRRQLLRRSSARVSASFFDNQFDRDAFGIECRLEDFGLLQGYEEVGVAMDQQKRRGGRRDMIDGDTARIAARNSSSLGGSFWLGNAIRAIMFITTGRLLALLRVRPISRSLPVGRTRRRPPRSCRPPPSRA